MVNKSLISGDEHVFPLTLTFAHVFISSFCDSIRWLVHFDCSFKYGVFPQERNAILRKEYEFLEHCPLYSSAGDRHDDNEASHLL